MTPSRLAALASCAAVLLSTCYAPSARAAAARDDRFLAGYVAALLELRFGLTGLDPEVQGGVLRLDAAELGDRNPQDVLGALAGIEGLVRVELSNGGAAPPAVTAEAPPRPPAEPAAPAAEAAEPPPPPLSEADERRFTGVLPGDEVFAPLLADPKEPQFAAAVQLYRGDGELDTVGSANFGAGVPLYGWEGLGARWQVGIQAGVFSIFDLEAESKDLVNADYFVGIPLSVGYGPLTARARLAHQSSHLGDEFLLRRRPDRINLSYEFADLLLSLDVFDTLRLYAGGGALLRSDPSDLDAPFVQGGVELTSPHPFLSELLFPVAAVDLQAAAETEWDLNLSVRAGVEVRSELLAGRGLQVLAGYYDGRSPNGQFYERSIDFYGLGLYFYSGLRTARGPQRRRRRRARA